MTVKLTNVSNEDILRTLSKLNPVLNYTFPVQTQNYLQEFANSKQISDVLNKSNALYTDLANVISKDMFFRSPIASELDFIKVVNGTNYGNVIRQMHVGIAKVFPFNPEKDRHYEPNPFIRVEDDVKALYIEDRDQTQSRQTVTYDEVVKSFRDPSGVGQLMNAKMASMESAYTLYLNTVRKAMIKIAEPNYAYVKGTKPVDQKSGETFIKEIIDLMRKMKRNTRDYNAANVIRSSSPEEMVLIIDDKYESILKVDVLSKAFNKEELTMPYKIVYTDEFGTTKKPHNVEGKFEEPVGVIDGAVALLVHKDFFTIENILDSHDFQKNAAGRYSNHFLDRDFKMYYTYFLPAVAIVENVPERDPESLWTKMRAKDEETGTPEVEE